MSEQEHTPGPWIWWYGENRDTEPIHDEPLRLLSDPTSDAVLAIRVCLNDIDGSGQLCAYLEGNVADMNLIAAAPDLLEACQIAQDLTDKWKRTEHGADFHEVDKVLRTTIARAKE